MACLGLILPHLQNVLQSKVIAALTNCHLLSGRGTTSEVGLYVCVHSLFSRFRLTTVSVSTARRQRGRSGTVLERERETTACGSAFFTRTATTGIKPIYIYPAGMFFAPCKHLGRSEAPTYAASYERCVG